MSMKKIKYSKFKNIDEIIEDMSQKPELQRAIKRNNLYKFWKKVAGEKFEKNSKPYSMLKKTTLVVACKTPAVAQELLLRKAKILEDIKPYAKSLKLDVKDIIFDTKKWSELHIEEG